MEDSGVHQKFSVFSQIFKAYFGHPSQSVKNFLNIYFPLPFKILFKPNPLT